MKRRPYGRTLDARAAGAHALASPGAADREAPSTDVPPSDAPSTVTPGRSRSVVPPDPATGISPAALLLGYAVLYCLLDWISFIQPLGGTEITAWNPQWALAVAMMARAPRLVWPVAVTLLAAAVQPALRHSPLPELLASSVEVLGDVAMAVAIRRWLGPAPTLGTRRAFVVFMLIVAVGGAIQTALYAGVLALLGAASMTSVRESLVSGWVGAVNLVVALPLIFALADRGRRAEFAQMLRTAEWWLIAGSAAAVSYAVFVRSMGDEFKHFYLLFLPVGWAAARFAGVGAIGAVTLVQLILATAAQSLPYEPKTVFELHLLLVSLGATGLLIGATVHEREEAEQALRASLHAAAAADMAAALAHELNQPLTSLVSYARATQLLVQRLEGAGDGAAAAPIVEVTRKLATEAMRAGEVVKRLRDFFRRGGTQLQNTDIAMLIEEVVRAHAPRAEVAGVALEWQAGTLLPPVLIDRVQIEVVLRNLVANALDAAALDRGGAPRVRLSAAAKGGQVVVQVCDSGAGVGAGQARRIFEDRKSSKPGGMGIGLAISRSIVEAHDGRLWAEPGPGGRFFFSLPHSLALDAPEPSDP